jgi:hypothetical protein
MALPMPTRPGLTLVLVHLTMFPFEPVHAEARVVSNTVKASSAVIFKQKLMHTLPLKELIII